jgi:hypothetical protein
MEEGRIPVLIVVEILQAATAYRSLNFCSPFGTQIPNLTPFQ